jgi:large repetitive protein
MVLKQSSASRWQWVLLMAVLGAAAHAQADTTPPNTFIDSSPRSPTNQAGATFNFSATETPVTYECSLDNGPFAACTNPVTFIVGEGSHTLRVVARDAAGNVDPTPARHSWTVDLTPPPAPAVTSPAPGARLDSTTPTFTGTAAAGSTVTILMDGVFLGDTVADGSGQWRYTVTAPLARGARELTAIATDEAGNDSDPTLVSFTVGAPPETRILSGPPALTNQRSATFDLEATVSDVTYECSLDDGAFAACADPLVLTSVAEGPHSLRARARDSAGQVDATPASYSWTVDTTPPAAPVVTSPTEGAVLGTATPPITGTAEPGSTVTVLLNNSAAGSATTSTSGAWTLTPTQPLARGSSTLQASARDGAGNTGPSSSRITFTVDPSLVDTTILSVPPPVTDQTVARFSFRASVEPATFQCNLDRQGFAQCPNPVLFENLTPGRHTLQVKAVDAQGREDPTPATYTWEISVPESQGCSGTGGAPALGLLGLLGLLAGKTQRKVL